MDGGANNRIFMKLHAEDNWYFHIKNPTNLKMTLSKQEAPAKKCVQFLLPTDRTRIQTIFLYTHSSQTNIWISMTA